MIWMFDKSFSSSTNMSSIYSSLLFCFVLLILFILKIQSKNLRWGIFFLHLQIQSPCYCHQLINQYYSKFQYVDSIFCFEIICKVLHFAIIQLWLKTDIYPPRSFKKFFPAIDLVEINYSHSLVNFLFMRLYFASNKPAIVTKNFSVSFCTELEKSKPWSVNFGGVFCIFQ